MRWQLTVQSREQQGRLGSALGPTEGERGRGSGALKGTEMKRRRAGSGARGRDVGEGGLDDCGGLSGWGQAREKLGLHCGGRAPGSPKGRQAVGEGGF